MKRLTKAQQEAELQALVAVADAFEAETPQPKRIRKPRTTAAEASPPATVTDSVETSVALKPALTRSQIALKDPQALLALVLSTLDDNKAEEVVTVDLAGKSSIADYMVVANGRSSRQVSALADHVVDAIGKAGFGHCRIEGKQAGDWVLIDAGDIIIHLFRPEVRDFYNLEKMWAADFRPAPEPE